MEPKAERSRAEGRGPEGRGGLGVSPRRAPPPLWRELHRWGARNAPCWCRAYRPRAAGHTSRRRHLTTRRRPAGAGVVAIQSGAADDWGSGGCRPQWNPREAHRLAAGCWLLAVALARRRLCGAGCRGILPGWVRSAAPSPVGAAGSAAARRGGAARAWGARPRASGIRGQGAAPPRPGFAGRTMKAAGGGNTLSANDTPPPAAGRVCPPRAGEKRGAVARRTGVEAEPA